MNRRTNYQRFYYRTTFITRFNNRSLLRLYIHYYKETYKVYIVYTITFVIKLKRFRIHVSTNYILRTRNIRSYYLRQRYEVYFRLLINGYIITRTQDTTLISVLYINE